MKRLTISSSAVSPGRSDTDLSLRLDDSRRLKMRRKGYAEQSSPLTAQRGRRERLCSEWDGAREFLERDIIIR